MLYPQHRSVLGQNEIGRAFFGTLQNTVVRFIRQNPFGYLRLDQGTYFAQRFGERM